MSFYSERHIKSVRKARQCCGCTSMLNVGDPALACSGRNYDNDFWDGAYHHDCRDAELALNKLHDTHWDEWVSLAEIEWDDYPWLLADFPTVAARMNITQERYDNIAAEQARMWERSCEQARKREVERQSEIAARHAPL